MILVPVRKQFKELDWKNISAMSMGTEFFDNR